MPGERYESNVSSHEPKYGLIIHGEHYLANRVLEAWDKCKFEGQNTAQAQDMGFYASEDAFEIAWDMLQKGDLMGISPSTARKIIAKSDFLVRPFKEKDDGDYLGYARAGARDFPMVQALPPDFDPDNLPEGWETRTDQVRDSQGKVHDVVRYLSPRSGRDFTYLQPFAEGRGWRTTRGAPTDPRPIFDEEWDDEEKEDSLESYNERLKNFEGEAIPDIIDTADHETGHVATQDELYSKYFTQDPTSIFEGLSSDEKSRVMARMLDDSKFARAKMREPRQPFPNRFSDKSTRSAWHERLHTPQNFRLILNMLLLSGFITVMLSKPKGEPILKRLQGRKKVGY